MVWLVVRGLHDDLFVLEAGTHLQVRCVMVLTAGTLVRLLLRGWCLTALRLMPLGGGCLAPSYVSNGGTYGFMVRQHILIILVAHVLKHLGHLQILSRLRLFRLRLPLDLLLLLVRCQQMCGLCWIILDELLLIVVLLHLLLVPRVQGRLIAHWAMLELMMDLVE